MKRQAREVYGRGPRLPTAEDKAAKLARMVLLLFALAAAAALALVSNGTIQPW